MENVALLTNCVDAIIPLQDFMAVTGEVLFIGCLLVHAIEYTHTYIHTYIYTYIHTYIHTYLYAYIHTHTHKYILRQYSID